MVALSRIVTKGGDKGKTSLGDGARVLKSDPRIEAIGAIDEANAITGLVRLFVPHELTALLKSIQNDLFDVGADLCLPDPSAKGLRVTMQQVEALEAAIDQYNASLLPLTSFILPGGSTLAAYLHVARTVVRRAERTVVGLQEQASLNPYVIQYLNRLSDLLFILARYTNDEGKSDILWVPGGERS